MRSFNFCVRSSPLLGKLESPAWEMNVDRRRSWHRTWEYLGGSKDLREEGRLTRQNMWISSKRTAKYLIGLEAMGVDKKQSCYHAQLLLELRENNRFYWLWTEMKLPSYLGIPGRLEVPAGKKWQILPGVDKNYTAIVLRSPSVLGMV